MMNILALRFQSLVPGALARTTVRNLSGADSNPFPGSEINHYRALFVKYDDNRDAHLDRWEFNNLVRHLVGRPYPTTDLDKVFKKIDATKDQFVSFSEWMDHMVSRYHPVSPLSTTRVFERFDKNNDGRMSWHETRQALFALGDDTERSDLFKKFLSNDKDNDEHLHYDEFVNLVKQIRKC